MWLNFNIGLSAYQKAEAKCYHFVSAFIEIKVDDYNYIKVDDYNYIIVYNFSSKRSLTS